LILPAVQEERGPRKGSKCLLKLKKGTFNQKRSSLKSHITPKHRLSTSEEKSSSCSTLPPSEDQDNKITFEVKPHLSLPPPLATKKDCLEGQLRNQTSKKSHASGDDSVKAATGGIRDEDHNQNAMKKLCPPSPLLLNPFTSVHLQLQPFSADKMALPLFANKWNVQNATFNQNQGKQSPFDGHSAILPLLLNSLNLQSQTQLRGNGGLANASGISPMWDHCRGWNNYRIDKHEVVFV
jgi:hypothetical protein